MHARTAPPHPRAPAHGRGALAALATLAAALLDACGNEGLPPVDPFALEAGGPGARLLVASDPLRLALVDGDDRALLASAPLRALEVGVWNGPAARYPSPLEESPRWITWHALDEAARESDAPGAVLAASDGSRATVEVSSPEDGVLRLRLALVAPRDDHALLRLRLASDGGGYHGLGERFTIPDARGSVVPMQLQVGGKKSGTNEHHVPVPFFVSTEGYGIFVRTLAAGAIDVASSDASEVRLTFATHELDVWFFVDPDPREVVARFSRATALPILPPRWAFAPMHWRGGWSSRAQVFEDAERIRAEDVPCTTFWFDNPWQVSFNDLSWDEGRFDDPASMLDALRALGYVPLLWSAPYLDAVGAGDAADTPAEALYEQAADEGWLVTQGGGTYVSAIAPNVPGALLDFTSEGATGFWRGRLEPLVDMGVRAFKLDYGEDVVPELLGLRTDFLFSDGRTEAELHKLYALLYHAPYRQALDARAGDDGGFLLVRASTWGGQAIADIVWPGDLDPDFRVSVGDEVGGLPAAVSALQSLAASGFPSFGSDTGGYRGGAPEREALLRWAEHTAFTPILQLGGGGEHHNPWLYDAEAGAIYQRLARAHMALVPYLRMHAIRASTDGYPPVSAAALVFPDDAAVAADPYLYLLGDDLLVAPVVEEGATTRAVRFPEGHWVHWFTGETYDGPGDAIVGAPLGTPPVFIRRGAVLPLLPADLDTLVSVDDAEVIDAGDRPYLRAWVFPEGTREISTEEGLDLRVARTTAGLELDVARRPGALLTDLRLRIELAHAAPPLEDVATVTVGGAPVAAASDVEAVEGGCEGTCWVRDGAVLLVSTRATSATHIVVE